MKNTFIAVALVTAGAAALIAFAALFLGLWTLHGSHPYLARTGFALLAFVALVGIVKDHLDARDRLQDQENGTNES